MKRPIFPRVQWFIVLALAILLTGALAPGQFGAGLVLGAFVAGTILLLTWVHWRSDDHLSLLFERRHVREAFAVAMRRGKWAWLRWHIPMVTPFEDLQDAFRLAVDPVVDVIRLASNQANTFIPEALKKTTLAEAKSTLEDVISVALRVALLRHFRDPGAELTEDLLVLRDRLTEVGRRAGAVQDALGKLTLGATSETLDEARDALTRLDWMATEQRRVEGQAFRRSERD